MVTLLRPGAGTSVRPGGQINGVGWVACNLRIASVDVALGGVPIGRARLGIAPAHLAALTGHHPADDETGFLVMGTVPGLPAGDALLTLRVATTGGVHEHQTRLVVTSGDVRPPAPALIRVECEAAELTGAGALSVKGWAVCPSGLVGVRVEFDGTLVGVVEPDEDAPAIGARSETVADSRQAGFRLEVELGRPMTGEHTVRIVAVGRMGEEHACLRTVRAAPPEPDLAEPDRIRFYLDSPTCHDGVAVEIVRGFLSLTGWAFSDGGIDRIEVEVDGQPQGLAHHGIRRADLQQAFPDRDALLSGFAMMIPPPVMTPGRHEIRLCLIGRTGVREEVRFTVQAERAASGPGPWMLRSKLPEAEIQLSHAILAARGWAPRFALLMAAACGSAAKAAALRTTLESLRWHAYADWTLVVVAPSAAQVAPIEAVTRAFGDVLADRVRVVAGQPKRLLAELAGDGSVVVVLGPGDRVGEDALLELAVAGALDPAAEFVYSDERRIDPADGEEKAFFKPDFSPDLLLATNYIGRLWSATTDLLRRTGMCEADLWELGDYHAVLALTERARRVAHVGKVLCHSARRPRQQQRDVQAIQAALRRRAVSAGVLPGAVPGSYHVHRPVRRDSVVSIIIPTIASKGLIATTIERIRANTNWPDYEIVCLDNIPPDGSADQRRWKRWIGDKADRVVEVAAPFNWSRFNNVGALAARGDILVFMNDDMEVLDADWLFGLVAEAQRPEIGVVGPQLLYPDGSVQHAGIFLGRGSGRHAFRLYPRDAPGPFGLALTQREVISVTGACMAMRRDVFEALGGFDELHDVVNNDLDFNLRVRRSGLSVVYTPAVSLVHHEMVSRAELGDDYNSAHFEREWGNLFRRGDPFFSRHFSPDYDDFVAEAEPVQVFTTGHPVVAAETIRRILVLKLDHIGDFVTAFPALRRIKQHFPAAHLTVLAATASVQLAALEPAIDAVIEFNFFHARSESGLRPMEAKRLAKLRAQLAPERFDLAIDLRRQPETRPILRETGARWLAGFDRGYEHPWLDFSVEFEGDFALKPKHGHVSDALIGLIDHVAASCLADRRTIATGLDRGAGRDFAAALLTEAERASLGRHKLVCIHTGAGAINKQWPAQSFAQLVDLLVADAGAAVVIVGAPDELAFAREVMALATRRERLFDVVGRATLADLPRLLSGAELYVGNDSGPKHIAAALGVPTVGIHSGTVDAGEWGPLGPSAVAVRRAMTCSPCYLAYASDCHRGLACLTGLPVGDVYEACRRMLALAAG